MRQRCRLRARVEIGTTLREAEAIERVRPRSIHYLVLSGYTQEVTEVDFRIKHLELVQSIVSRLAGNSASLKTWSVTLIAGLFALAAKDTENAYFMVAYLPCLTFWGLDSYYLSQERRFRDLFNEIEQNPVSGTRMNMTTDHLKRKSNSWAACVLSRTEIAFYVPLLAAVAAVTALT